MNKVESIARLNEAHQLNLVDADVYVFDGEMYISSSKAAEMLHMPMHSFSNYYVPAFSQANLVKRLILGRCRWYVVADLEKLLRLSIKSKKSLFQICEEARKLNDKKHIKHASKKITVKKGGHRAR
jgi:hypothetical protein